MTQKAVCQLSWLYMYVLIFISKELEGKNGIGLIIAAEL